MLENQQLRGRVRALQSEVREMRQNSVSIQARAEQEEELIANTLMKKIHELRKEKEALAVNYEQVCFRSTVVWSPHLFDHAKH